MLSGPDEASLTFLAVRRWLGWSAGHLLVLDIGGGSLEMAVGRDEAPVHAISVPLGAGRLTRDWFTTDPPQRRELKSITEYAHEVLAPAATTLLGEGPPGPRGRHLQDLPLARPPHRRGPAQRRARGCAAGCPRRACARSWRSSRG